MAPSKKDVFDAISSYSPQVLKRHLEAGYDINLPIFGRDCGLKTVTHGTDQENIDEDWKIGNWVTDAMIFPLHAAVIFLYHAVNKGSHTAEKALETIDVLINHSSRSASAGCSNLMIFNAAGYTWLRFKNDSGYGKNLPIHVAMFLKKYPWEYNEDETIQYLDEAINKLQTAMEKTDPPRIDRVLSGVISSYKSMLFSEDFSDITFVCSDDISIPAHKVILAGSSDYFKAALKGPWSENNPDGKWKTAHDSKRMKALLTVMYTGSVKESEKLAKDMDPKEFFEVVHEFGVGSLMKLATTSCIIRINEKSVKEMMQLAHLHCCKDLKIACFQYAQNKAGKVLTQPEMVKLATEDPDLWQEMCDFVNEVPASKRQRKA